MLAIFVHFQTSFQGFFIALGKVIDFAAFLAFHFDQVVLGHKINLKSKVQNPKFWMIFN